MEKIWSTIGHPLSLQGTGARDLKLQAWVCRGSSGSLRGKVCKFNSWVQLSETICSLVLDQIRRPALKGVWET